jgi:xanthine/CO dehydrogenase XdhC/CoxF family maturation factor
MIEHFGQTEESLARLRGPIGLYIGSKTPSEIAVSVIAEILAVKNGVTLPRDQMPSDVSTTMIYTYELKVAAGGAASPLD